MWPRSGPDTVREIWLSSVSAWSPGQMWPINGYMYFILEGKHKFKNVKRWCFITNIAPYDRNIYKQQKNKLIYFTLSVTSTDRKSVV